MTDRLRDHLRDALQRKVDAHGVVVWDDPAQEYDVSVAQAVAPSGATFVGYDGSWYEVRRAIESALAAPQPPSLVVYASASALVSDPLAEARDAGTSWTIRLATLVRQALAGQLTETRCQEIGREARTIHEAEAAASGSQGADVRLVAQLGTSDSVQMALRVLIGSHDEALTDAWPDVAAFAERSFGCTCDGAGDELRAALARHLLLTELSNALGSPPEGVAPGWTSPSTSQTRACLDLLASWRRDRDAVHRYAALLSAADRDLGLPDALGAHPALADLQTSPSVEAAVLAEALALLDANECDAAADLAVRRLDDSIWTRVPFEPPLEGAETWGPRWRAVRGVAGVRSAVARLQPPPGGVAMLLDWYASDGYAADNEHRRLELAAAELLAEGRLEEPISVARGAYEDWLDVLLQRFTAEAKRGFDIGNMTQQGSIGGDVVSDRGAPVAYVVVDALRYELGCDLAARLRRTCDDLSIRPAVAACPTITPVGMANLCPGADASLAIELDARSKLRVQVGDVRVDGVPERVDLLRAAHGTLANLTLSHVCERGERQLAKDIEGAKLVLVRSQEIDAAGESGMLAVGWDAFENTLQQIERAVVRLSHAGVRSFVISADHGFLVLSRGLRPDRVVASPSGGKGEGHRRAWVGRGGVDADGTVRVPLAGTGVRTDLDLVVPTNLAVFGTRGGTRQFFHGGLSPQELIVPLVLADARAPSGPSKAKVRAEVAGGRLTTGVFSCSLTLEPDLFTSELEVRTIVTRGSDDGSAALPISGDGYDPQTNTILITCDRASVITFRLTANLARDEKVSLTVLDASSDRLLARTEATAQRALTVEDELD
ncbi:MAG TPA: PglZ domain-containing protein [Actinomycetota bacterium]|nr:PglZ domain-containing protein [Actinomycetota bacterium]